MSEINTDIKAIDSVGVPPLPIPNREVKPNSADGTANVCGRVGHRHFFFEREFQAIETLFFFVIGALEKTENGKLFTFQYSVFRLIPPLR